MRILFITLVTLFSFSFSNAQVYNPVKWSFSHQLEGNNHAILKFTAKIDAGWHVYSTTIEDGIGPIPTSFDFQSLDGAELVGGLIEPMPHKEYDPNFDMELLWFEKQVTLQQKVKLTKPFAKVKGELTYMTCDDSKCLPPEYIEFDFDIEQALKPGGETGAATPAKASNESTSNSAGKDHGEAPSAAPTSNIENPVKWHIAAEKQDEQTYTIRATASIAEGWHVYSKDLPNEDGPVATEFSMLSGSFEAIGELREIGEMHHEYDPNFMMELSYYEGQMTLEQTIKTNGEELIRGELYYMCCDAEKCLPPTTEEFSLNPLTGEFVASTDAADQPTEQTTEATEGLKNLKIGTIDLKSPVNECGDEGHSSDSESSGFLTIFLLGFLGGLVALLTPCVFPMIPLTVSFFTKSSSDKKKGMSNAMLYGLSIFLIYVVLSIPFHLLDSLDPEILNTISTNAWLNVAYFVIFVGFAISFFGYYEITLPSGMANKVDTASNLGGLIGIFFMALTLAIVSFSCTGPILGTLLAGAITSDGGAMQLTSGMAGFGLALALPFGLFAAFPGWLNSLPKSGGWLNQVKVVLGFVEVALAVKFLSNADLVEHWNILKIEPFLIIWILCGLGIVAYLMGWIRFPHDSPGYKPGKVALSVAAVFFALSVYMITGFRYDEKSQTFTSLTLLSGIAPSAGYSYIHPSPCPLGLNCFHEYEDGLAFAKETNKPILIDFTGYACVNCRKMEENVWPDPEIYSRISEDYVLISLYVDDRKELPEEERFEFVTSTGRRKKIKTYGDKWATMETETFGTNSQPHYALISPAEELLNVPVGYTPDKEEYKQFLDCGIEAFEIKSKVVSNP
ncbi:MAG: protein-disulfide reductase DsbD family protein [Flavobacteriales bacterium]